MNNLIYILANGDLSDDICVTLEPIMTIVGYVIFAIKVIVPVILVLFGMIDLTKAIMEKDESNIKKAQSLLIKRIIYGVAVYLVVTIVSLIMNLIVSDDSSWKSCVKCAFDVTGNDCSVMNNAWEN